MSTYALNEYIRSGIIEPMHIAVASTHAGRAIFAPIAGTWWANHVNGIPKSRVEGWRVGGG